MDALHRETMGTRLPHGLAAHVFLAPPFLLISLSCGTGFDLPPKPPEVTTHAASDIGRTSSTLNGNVNPNGAPAVAWFEWGLDEHYGNGSTRHDLGSAAVEITVNQRLQDALIPGTVYHYRVVAENKKGTTHGEDRIFMTSTLEAPIVATGLPTHLSESLCTLDGRVNPNGLLSEAWFEWGLDVSYGNETPRQMLGNGLSELALIEQIMELSFGTSYHYRIVAENEGGISYGEDAVCTTMGPLPILSYRMEDHAGPVLDSSGWGHDGTSSGVARGIVGRVGKGFSFDGSSSISVGEDSVFRLSSFTIMGWIRPVRTLSTDPMTIVRKGSNGQLNYRLQFYPIGSGDDWCFILDFDSAMGTNEALRAPCAPLVPGIWYHVTGMYDHQSGVQSIYLDGVEFDRRTVDPPNRATMKTDINRPLFIGVDIEHFPSPAYYVGGMDELKIFDQVLTAQEVSIEATVDP